MTKSYQLLFELEYYLACKSVCGNDATIKLSHSARLSLHCQQAEQAGRRMQLSRDFRCRMTALQVMMTACRARLVPACRRFGCRHAASPESSPAHLHALRREATDPDDVGHTSPGSGKFHNISSTKGGSRPLAPDLMPRLTRTLFRRDRIQQRNMKGCSCMTQRLGVMVNWKRSVVSEDACEWLEGGWYEAER